MAKDFSLRTIFGELHRLLGFVFMSRWWPVARIISIVLLCIVGVPLLCIVAFLIRLSYGPLEITPLVHRFTPIVLVPGKANAPPAASLDVEHVYLGWNGLHRGVRARFFMRFANAHILNAQDQIIDTVRNSMVVLRTRALMKGEVSVDSIVLEGADMHLVRQPDGNFGLDVPDAVPDNSPPPQIDFSKFRSVKVSDIHATIRDKLIDSIWKVNRLDLDVHSVMIDQRLGAIGDINIALNMEGQNGGEKVGIHAHGDVINLGRKKQGLRWHVGIDPVTPAGFSTVLPALAGLSAVNVPLGVQAEFLMKPAAGSSHFVLPSSVQAKVTMGTGKIKVGDGVIPMIGGETYIESPIPASLNSALRVLMKSGQFYLASSKYPQNAKYGLPVKTTGYLYLPNVEGSKIVDILLSIDAQKVDLAHLAEYWPEAISKSAREWVVENLESGMARNFHMDIGLGSHTGWEGLDIASLAGHVDAEQVKVHWMRPIPPLQDMKAHMRFKDKNTILITLDQATQTVHPDVKRIGSMGSGKIMLHKGQMIISGLMDKVQIGHVQVPMTGDVRDILAVLDEPKFNLFPKSGLPFEKPKGNAKINLTVQLPLVSDILLKDVHILADVDITSLSLANIVLGRPLEGGVMHLRTTTEKLDMKGTARLAGIATEFTYAMDYTAHNAGQISQQALAHLRVTRADLEREFPFTQGIFHGVAPMEVKYVKRGNGAVTVDLDGDLTQTLITTPIWYKAYGTTGRLQAHMHPSGNDSFYVDAFQVEAPGLHFVGRANLSSSLPQNLVEGDFQINGSSGYTRVAYPTPEGGGLRNGPIHIAVVAHKLDITRYVQEDPTTASRKEPKKGFTIPSLVTGAPQLPARPWDMTFQADEVIIEPKKILHHVTLQLASNGTRLSNAYGDVYDVGRMRMMLFEEGQKRPLYFQVNNSGEVLGRLGMIDHLEGGYAYLSGQFDDTKYTAPFDGKLTIGPFHMMQAPKSLLLANNLSIYGWILGPKPPEFDLNKTEAELHLDNNVINIIRGQASNSSLGATFTGPIHLKANKMHIQGTVVPAFIINTLPGKIPLIGELFSPEEGGGLISATFEVVGPLDSPDVKVHPFSVLLPGILRKLIQ